MSENVKVFDKIYLNLLIKQDLPKRMLAEFSKLVGTLKRTIPATERGILFNDPTRLQKQDQECDPSSTNSFLTTNYNKPKSNFSDPTY